MSKMAFVYPGQGVQNPGMGADFYKESKEAEQIYNEAESILDFDIKKVCFEENDLINNTEYTQAALVTTYLAITGEVIKGNFPGCYCRVKSWRVWGYMCSRGNE